MDTEHVDFVEQENARLAARVIAAEARADRATRDVASLELQLEEQGRVNASLLAGASASPESGLRCGFCGSPNVATSEGATTLGKLTTLHQPTLSEHYAVTSLVRAAQRLSVKDLEVHVFIGGRRLI
jgi:hypothetical protein